MPRIGSPGPRTPWRGRQARPRWTVGTRRGRRSSPRSAGTSAPRSSAPPRSPSPGRTGARCRPPSGSCCCSCPALLVLAAAAGVAASAPGRWSPREAAPGSGARRRLVSALVVLAAGLAAGAAAVVAPLPDKGVAAALTGLVVSAARVRWPAGRCCCTWRSRSPRMTSVYALWDLGRPALDGRRRRRRRARASCGPGSRWPACWRSGCSGWWWPPSWRSSAARTSWWTAPPRATCSGTPSSPASPSPASAGTSCCGTCRCSSSAPWRWRSSSRSSCWTTPTARWARRERCW